MVHAWVRLHDHLLAPEPEEPTQRLIDALRRADVAVAGWGFVRGWQPKHLADGPEHEAAFASGQVRKYGLTHYVADIEQDEHDSRWDVGKIPRFLTTLRGQLPAGAQIVVSSYPYIGRKHPELMRAAAPHADAFAPQIYWLDYPAAYMLEAANRPANPTRDYGQPACLHNPAVYADLCLDWWRNTVGAEKPLILTGQAYWENFPRDRAEAKLAKFLGEFTGWPRVTGVNWWHFGHKTNPLDNGAMTPRMFEAIVNARLDQKTYAQG